ncbi:NAD-dependent protein deacetylase sirtuin-1 [Mactra antiquata]
MADNESETHPRKKMKLDRIGDDLDGCDIVDSSQNDGKAIANTVNKDNGESPDNVYGDSNAVQSNEIDSHTVEDEGGQENGSDNGKNENDVTGDADDDDKDSDISGLSDMSELSGEESWKAKAPGIGWIYKAMMDGVDPRFFLRQIIPDDTEIPDVDNFTLWRLVLSLTSEPPPRTKLADVNTLDDVISLLNKSQKIMVLTGAGVSVSCGIPDFRSRNGIYARLAVDFPDLPDPQAMFDINYFKNDQRPFFKFAKEIFPGQFEPSKSHKFIQLIEEHGKLLRNYTQNIDTLEQVAGIKNVIQCHGSFATATCMTCHHKVCMDDIKSHVMEQNIPWCDKCDPRTPLSIMKPDIVFFGESLPEEFHNQMSLDKDECDLLIVIGSSLKVRPVALIPNSLPAHVPQILINKEHLRHLNFDVELLGDCDTIMNEICRRLGNEWTKICDDTVLTQIAFDDLPTPPQSPVQNDHSKPDTVISTSKLKDDCNSIDDAKNVEKRQECVSEEMEIDKESKDSAVCSTNVDSSEKCENSKSVESMDNESPVESSSKNDIVPVESSNTDDTGLVESSSKDDKMPEGNSSKDDTGRVESSNKDGEASTSISDKNIEQSDKDATNTETKTVGKDVEQPGCSYKDNKASASTDSNVITSSYWAPKRQNIADRLGENQFCFIPPCTYIFPEAEFFKTFDSDNDDDGDSDDKDSSLDSYIESDQNNSSEVTASDKVNDKDVESNKDKETCSAITQPLTPQESSCEYGQEDTRKPENL